MSEPRTIERDERVAGYLGGCFDELYRSLGAGAASISDDSVVVLAFDLAREFADVREAFARLLARRAGVDAASAFAGPSVIESTLSSAIDSDDSGALAMYVLSMVIAPRLLVSLRDAAESALAASGAPLAGAARAGASALLGAQRRIADVSSRRASSMGDSIESLAHRLEGAVDEAGFAESFGLGLPG